MRVAVVDGQGGGIGRAIVERIRKEFPDITITALGTNSTATGQMVRAGANEGATGENAIIHNVKNFILTFGKDFAFVRNQYHLDAFGEDQYIDLLFFNRELNCLVAVELKKGKFKTSYLGQLQGYLSVLDGFERKPHENPAIGIILCKDMNKSFVDYVIQDYTKPMGVATYKTSKDMSEELKKALPPIEALKKLLDAEDLDEE